VYAFAKCTVTRTPRYRISRRAWRKPCIALRDTIRGVQLAVEKNIRALAKVSGNAAALRPAATRCTFGVGRAADVRKRN